jgi:hypothetical protein
VPVDDLPRSVHVLEEVVMRWLPRLRLAFARRPWLYWLVAGSLIVLAWWQVSSVHAAARRARDAWGTTVEVWVSSTDAAAGAPLAIERREYPTAMVPTSALADLHEPVIAARHVAAGAVLVGADVVGDHALPDSWIVFAIAADGAPALVQGDGVAVFAAGQRLCDGTVAAPPGEQVEFGVPAECGGAVGNAVALGEVVLARRA